MAQTTEKLFHTGIIKKTVQIRASKAKVWRKISDIVGLPSWVVDVKETVHISEKKRGVGAVRLLTFADGNTVEEHVISWTNGESFTYAAAQGLPLRVYVATISVKSRSSPSSSSSSDAVVDVLWQSYFNSKKMSEKQFLDFYVFMGSFYEASLANLKLILEK